MSTDTVARPAQSDPPAEAPLDTRPILPRTADNPWERNEQLRTDLHNRLEALCAGRRMEALVLQSHPYVHPAWVKFESWFPTAERGITARATMTITLSTKPYHRYEAIYRIDWERHGKKGAFDHLYEFGEAEASRMVDFLSAPPKRSLAGRQVKRILRRVQLRQAAWQVWRPRNKVLIVRRDWAQLASFASLALGAIMVAGSLQDAGGLNASGSALPGTDRPELAVAALPPTLAAPAPDVPTVPERRGAPDFEVLTRNAAVSGRLGEGNPRFDNGRLYEARTFTAAAGERIVVTMRSPDFDTYLMVGQNGANGFTILQENDDGGDSGTDSQIEFVAPAADSYLVVASSFDPGKAGRYSLTIR